MKEMTLRGLMISIHTGRKQRSVREGVEDADRDHGRGTRRCSATIVTHSMGDVQGLYFLQSQDDAWKSKYIKRWIPISAPLIGAAKEFRLFATGDNEGLPVQASSIRDEQRSYETNLWLSPL